MKTRQYERWLTGLEGGETPGESVPEEIGPGDIAVADEPSARPDSAPSQEPETWEDSVVGRTPSENARPEAGTDGEPTRDDASAEDGGDSLDESASPPSWQGLVDPSLVPVNEPKGRSSRLSPRRRWTLRRCVAVGALAACLFGIGVVLWSRLGGNGAGRSVQLQAVRPESPGDMKAVGVEASGEYARRSASYATASADAAARDGRTYVAPLVPSVRPALQPTPAPEPREEPARKTVITVPPRPAPAAPAPQPRRQGDARIVGYLGQLDKRWQPQGGAAVMTLNPPTPKVRAGSQAPEVRDVREGLPGLKPGDILYCVNRVSLDSDAPGPAMVEVLEGPYAGARAIGSFTRAGEHLVLEFSSLTLSDGRNHPVRGYAIDPRTDRTAVRSAVDTHAVERWLKFAAAKFLEGFGDAVSSTRSSAYVTPYGSGYTTSRLDLHEQLWSAAGKVGQGAARMLERDFSVPPTVTLRSGTEMGVLLVQVGAAEAPAARESGGRGSDAQEGGGRRDGGYYGTRQQQMESSRGRSP